MQTVTVAWRPADQTEGTHIRPPQAQVKASWLRLVQLERRTLQRMLHRRQESTAVMPQPVERHAPMVTSGLPHKNMFK
jgi:hypothetical protein